jgi:hypothetical protein
MLHVGLLAQDLKKVAEFLIDFLFASQRVGHFRPQEFAKPLSQAMHGHPVVPSAMFSLLLISA